MKLLKKRIVACQIGGLFYFSHPLVYMKDYLSLIKFSHTIFALPFAIIGFFLAVFVHGYELNWTIFFLMILCMVFARSAAMAFNRYIDRDIDVKNPRTAIREIPAGTIAA